MNNGISFLIDKKTKGQWESMKLPIPLGKDESGEFHLEDLTQIGNIIIGGSTGSGKSIFNHNLICSLILKYGSSQLKFFLADPKIVELPYFYNKLPHVLEKVYTKPEDIINQLFSLKREILNKKYQYLAIVIDTFSDLMAYDSEKFESVISDLSNLNERGVYMAICDSRTGKDVFSPKIMRCFPTRIAFNTCDKESSYLLIKQSGAETLKGAGDMLFLPKKSDVPVRLQGPYISEEEVQDVIKRCS